MGGDRFPEGQAEVPRTGPRIRRTTLVIPVTSSCTFSLVVPLPRPNRTLQVASSGSRPIAASTGARSGTVATAGTADLPVAEEAKVTTVSKKESKPKSKTDVAEKTAVKEEKVTESPKKVVKKTVKKVVQKSTVAKKDAAGGDKK